MYHRILPPHAVDAGIEPGMFVFDHIFDEHIALLKNQFTIVSLADLLVARSEGWQEPAKPWCALTFDDGWLDFYAHAYPVLISHKTPATVFLPTDFIGTANWFWTDRLGFMLQQHRQKNDSRYPPSVPSDAALDQFLDSSASLEKTLNQAISYLKRKPPKEIERILQELASSLQTASEPPGRAFVTWNEVREMAATHLISFGSHTAGHPILTSINEARIKRELMKSKGKLISEKAASDTFLPFCYPNGSYNRQIIQLVKEAGYHLAVSTENGWNGAGDHLMTLKRIPIHNDMTATRGMLLCRITGFF